MEIRRATRRSEEKKKREKRKKIIIIDVVINNNNFSFRFFFWMRNYMPGNWDRNWPFFMISFRNEYNCRCFSLDNDVVVVVSWLNAFWESPRLSDIINTYIKPNDSIASASIGCYRMRSIHLENRNIYVLFKNISWNVRMAWETF